MADELRAIRASSRALVAALVGAALLVAALVPLRRTTEGLRIETSDLDGTPVTTFHAQNGAPHAVVIIAHGFAGSQQLMQPFATTLARNGYTAVTFDFPGHGRNAAPLTGDITVVEGATRTLVRSVNKVATYARGLGAGPIAVLGHSMATDVVVRFAEENPDVAATIAVSMFSPAVTERAPRNLLVIVGEWETTLKREALRAVGLASAPAAPEAFVTYGDPRSETGRRAAWSPHVEHVGVLYSQASMRQAVAWLDATFGVARTAPPVVDARGPWILLLLGAIVLLAYPLSRLLPAVSREARGASLSWRQLALPLVVPALVTPLILRFVPTHFLPVLVADYLSVHFAIYGLTTCACLTWIRRKTARRDGPPSTRTTSWPKLALATIAMTAYATVALGCAIDRYVTSFAASGARVPLLLAMAAGTLSFFLADEWTTRGAPTARGAYLATKVAFLVSLLIAVALDPKRLFFLLIIVPVIVTFLVMYGFFSAWAYRRTKHPFVGAIASALGFAWAIAVTFPLIAG